VQQSDPDDQPALHSARKLLGLFSGPVGQPNELQHFVRPGAEFLPAQPLEASEEPQVFPRRQVRIDREFLRDQADVSLWACTCWGHTFTHDGDRAGVGRDQAGHHRDNRGLACTVWSKQAVGFSRPDVKGYSVDDGSLAVAFDQASDRQDILRPGLDARNRRWPHVRPVQGRDR
jgi:hypothetical protein